MEAKAIAKYIRTSARKARLVVDMVRGKKVEEALNTLHFTPQKASGAVEKVVRSAVANAMNSEDAADLNPEELRISEIFVDEGPTMRRYQPRAMGRAGIIRKRSCHISVVVSDDPVKR